MQYYFTVQVQVIFLFSETSRSPLGPSSLLFDGY